MQQITQILKQLEGKTHTNPVTAMDLHSALTAIAAQNAEILKVVSEQAKAIEKLKQENSTLKAATSSPVATQAAPHEESEFMTTEEVAAYVHKSVSTIKQDRLKDEPLYPYMLSGRRVLYRKVDLTKALNAYNEKLVSKLSQLFPVFQYENKFLGIQAAYEYEQSNPDLMPTSVEELDIHTPMFQVFGEELLSPTLPALSPEIVKNFDTGTWLMNWTLGGQKTPVSQVIKALSYLTENGVNFNQDIALFHRNPAHVLAMYGSQIEDTQALSGLLNELQYNGLDFTSKDSNGKESIELAPKNSAFQKWIQATNMRQLLESKLSKKDDDSSVPNKSGI